MKGFLSTVDSIVLPLIECSINDHSICQFERLSKLVKCFNYMPAYHITVPHPKFRACRCCPDDDDGAIVEVALVAYTSVEASVGQPLERYWSIIHMELPKNVSVQRRR